MIKQPDAYEFRCVRVVPGEADEPDLARHRHDVPGSQPFDVSRGRWWCYHSGAGDDRRIRKRASVGGFGLGDGGRVGLGSDIGLPEVDGAPR